MRTPIQRHIREIFSSNSPILYLLVPVLIYFLTKNDVIFVWVFPPEVWGRIKIGMVSPSVGLRRIHIVKPGQQWCSCGMWQEFLYPCRYGCAVYRCSSMWCTRSTGVSTCISCSQQTFFQHALTTWLMTVKPSHQLWLGNSLGVQKLKDCADEVSTLMLKSPRSAAPFVCSKDTIRERAKTKAQNCCRASNPLTIQALNIRWWYIVLVMFLCAVLLVVLV
jgi:SWIM zinc finger